MPPRRAVAWHAAPTPFPPHIPGQARDGAGPGGIGRGTAGFERRALAGG